MDSPPTQKQFTTVSGIPLRKVYTPQDVTSIKYDQDLGAPGAPPYVRGAFPNMYRDKPWRISQLHGAGTMEESRKLLEYSLAQGDKLIMFEHEQAVNYSMMDVDDPEILWRKDDIGLTGTPFMSLRDYEELFQGLDSLPPGGYPMDFCFGLACGVALAEKRGIPLSEARLRGHGDVFAAYIGTPFYKQIPPRAGFRMVYDGMEFVIRNCPKALSPVNNPGHNARANGINAYQEIAMVLANAIDRFDEMQRRGLAIDQVAPFLATVNFASHRDFFEEICKMRAFRRMWYRLLTQRYQATTPRALAVRMHAITCSDDLSYQQPMNNIVRNTMRALAAALAGVQGLGVAGYDEAISAPTKESLLLSIRTQQVIQLESGVANVIDPLGGSYYIEWLTNEIEQQAWDYLREIEDRGGLLSIIESGWAHKEAWKGQTERENKVASGEMKVVGVNCYQMEEEPFSVPSYRPNPKVWEDAMARLNEVRQMRDEQKVTLALEELRRVAQTKENIMPAMIAAVKDYVTIGEVGRLWRELFGIWKVPYTV